MTSFLPGLQLIPVGAGDLPALLALYRQCEDFLVLGPQPLASPEMVLADLRLSEQTGGVFYGIFDHTGCLLGVVDFISQGFEGQAEVGFITLLMIAAPYRSRGLGSQVVRWVEQAAAEAGSSLLQAGVQVNNPAALRFWQRQGFAICSGPVDYPDGTTAWTLEKRIKPV